MKTISPFWPVLLGCAALLGCQNTIPPAPRQPLLGLQAYTFRDLSVAETIEKAEGLGIRYIQLFPSQRLGTDKQPVLWHTMDESARATLLAYAKAHHVELVSYGVINGKDEADWRQIFAFAKAMGLQNIAVEPPETEFPLLARLSTASGVGVTIHDHVLPSRYADPEVALAAIKPYPSFGLCADTGHWVRSGYNAVAMLRKAEGRITSLHFKDVEERGARECRDMPWGTGVSDIAGQVLELRRQGFTGIVFVEYETNSPTRDAEVARSVAYFRRLITASDDDLRTGRVAPEGFTRNPDDLWANARGHDSKRWPVPRPLLTADLGSAEFAPGTWAWEDGLLVSKGGGDLWLKEPLSDFVLSFEFRCDEGAASGVYLRCTDTADPLRNALKIQILQGDNADDKRITGALFDRLPPQQKVAIDPGTWHRVVIVARGNKLTVSIDNRRLIHTDLVTGNPWVDATPEQTADAYKKGLAPSGRVGLQAGTRPVAFRDLRIDLF